MMTELDLCLIVQLSLAVGVAGLFWPERLMPLFQVLMFPWSATYRAIRVHSIVAIFLSALLFGRLALWRL